MAVKKEWKTTLDQLHGQATEVEWSSGLSLPRLFFSIIVFFLVLYFLHFKCILAGTLLLRVSCYVGGGSIYVAINYYVSMGLLIFACSCHTCFHSIVSSATMATATPSGTTPSSAHTTSLFKMLVLSPYSGRKYV